jgi:hypothetical protein
MRNEVVVLLAVVSSVIYLTPGVARAQPGSIVAPHMIIWSMCGALSNGSAFSAYSMSETQTRSAPEPPAPTDVSRPGCVAGEDEGEDTDGYAGAHSPARKY